MIALRATTEVPIYACGGGPCGTQIVLAGSLAFDIIDRLHGRGLHSSTFRLNVSAFCGIGEGCLGGVSGVFGGMRGKLGVFCVRNGSS